MWDRLKREPKIVYHFTKKVNVAAIQETRQLKKFKDTYVFVCESYQGCVDVFKATRLNPNARYVDFDGIVKVFKEEDKNPDNFVVLKLEVRNSHIMDWYASKSSKEGVIDDVTIAYMGNLPIKVLEVLPLKVEV